MTKTNLRPRSSSKKKIAYAITILLIIAAVAYAVWSYQQQQIRNAEIRATGALKYNQEQGFASEFFTNEPQTEKISLKNIDYSTWHAKISVFEVSGPAGFTKNDVSATRKLYSAGGSLFQDFGDMDFTDDGGGYLAYHGINEDIPAGFEGYYLITVTFKDTAPLGYYTHWMLIDNGVLPTESYEWQYTNNIVLKTP